MIFFHPGGHGLFLLGLCLLAPAIALGVIAALGGAASLRHRGQVEQEQGGLALTTGQSAPASSLPHVAPKQGPLAASDEVPAQITSVDNRQDVVETQQFDGPRHALNNDATGQTTRVQR